MIEIRIDPSWPQGARMGLLEARGLPPLASHPALEARRALLEDQLRETYAGRDRQALKALPVMAVFAAHFKPHGQTYHVLRQLESVALKARPIPSQLCAVTALFMAELAHGLVAAGHDLDRLAPPLTLARSQGGESYRGFGDRAITLPAGDLTLRHRDGILSSVLQGPDGATPIGPETRDVLYTHYAPAGIDPAVLQAQLDDLAGHLRSYAPEAALETRIIP
jgi:DNA/RNA-binding domain of Phe-tRNA-synthetase-like protein